MYDNLLSFMTARAAHLCSFNRSLKTRGFGLRSRIAMIHQAGNAMTVPIIGAFLLWAILFVKPKISETQIADTPRLLSILDRKRRMRSSDSMSPSTTTSTASTSSCSDGALQIALEVRLPSTTSSIVPAVPAGVPEVPLKNSNSLLSLVLSRKRRR